MYELNYIDLFSGAGGLSEGFINAGFNPIAHIEMDTSACYTLKTRAACHYLKSINQYDTYTAYLKKEISRDELYTHIPDEIPETIINLPIGGEQNRVIHRKIKKILQSKEVDVIIGGPPCQAYSLIGRATSKDNMESDKRNYLYIQYAKYLEKYKPKIFIFENVLGLKSAKEGHYLRNMENLFLKKGYQMKLHVVNAKDFGVLQNRKRVIIIGWRTDFLDDAPDLTTNFKANYKVRDLFSDLPEIQAGQGIDKYTTYKYPTNSYLEQYHIRNGINILTQHVARPHTDADKKIYKYTVKQWDDNRKRLNYNELPERLKTRKSRTSFLDSYKVVAADEPCSHTVVAHIAKDGHHYIHPDIQQNRSITVREAARLQSFPDDYYFEGIKEGKNRTAAFRQIGNAVPPLMSYQIAQRLKSILV